jgi:hypothetical protein
MFIARTRSVTHPKSGIDPNLPAGLSYARDEPLRSQFTKRQTRHLEAANKSAPAPGDFAPIHNTRWAGVTRQLRERSIVFFRLKFRALRGVFFHRCTLSLIAINPGSLGHKKC